MDMNKLPYFAYSRHLKEKYGEKAYKLPINLPITCPNRDGNLGVGGCNFCGDVGAGFENLPNYYDVKKQLNENAQVIRKKYNVKKFIAYFQNYSNTYMKFEEFKRVIGQAIMEDIVEISISTRPDCISEKYLSFLSQIKEQHKIEISIELGLQTANYHALEKINRGHTLAEYIDAVFQINKYGFDICTHLILNLPWDTMIDVVENAKILSALRTHQVKLHALYILKGTEMGRMYTNEEFKMISVEEYKERVIVFLEHLSPNIAVQRLIGRAPRGKSLFVNWSMSWWKIRDEIHDTMWATDRFQGKKANYLNGKALNYLKSP
ncbi:MAG: TIGR01212 family radical SAM protein [Alkaliphilus sp.]